MINRRNLPLSGLRAFECAARHLHLGRAGEELGVTHGAISHQIRKLEKTLGVELFSRAHNRLDLTAAGRRLFDAVREGLDKIAAGTQNLDPENIAGTLTIGCTQTIATSWAIKHICAFQHAYPQIDIRVFEVFPTQTDIDQSIDIAICYGAPDNADRVVVELTTPDVFPVCSPRLIHGQSIPMRTEDISAMTLLHDRHNSWQDWFETANLTYPQTHSKMEFAHTYMAISAARMGYGVALCNMFEVREDLNEGVLVQITGHKMPESHGYFLLKARPQNQTLRSRLFEDWLLLALSNDPDR